jgi:hypothetical protein
MPVSEDDLRNAIRQVAEAKTIVASGSKLHYCWAPVETPLKPSAFWPPSKRRWERLKIMND